jgi:hypothetical protein
MMEEQDKLAVAAVQYLKRYLAPLLEGLPEANAKGALRLVADELDDARRMCDDVLGNNGAIGRLSAATLLKGRLGDDHNGTVSD